MSTAFVPFFFDSNSWHGVVDSPEKWFELITAHSDLDRVLNAKMAPQSEIDRLPSGYHFGALDVRTGGLRSFGFRREHAPGTVRLGDWATRHGMNLHALAKKRPRALRDQRHTTMSDTKALNLDDCRNESLDVSPSAHRIIHDLIGEVERLRAATAGLTRADTFDLRKERDTFFTAMVITAASELPREEMDKAVTAAVNHKHVVAMTLNGVAVSPRTVADWLERAFNSSVDKRARELVREIRYDVIGPIENVLQRFKQELATKLNETFGTLDEDWP